MFIMQMNPIGTTSPSESNYHVHQCLFIFFPELFICLLMFVCLCLEFLCIHIRLSVVAEEPQNLKEKKNKKTTINMHEIRETERQKKIVSHEMLLWILIRSNHLQRIQLSRREKMFSDLICISKQIRFLRLHWLTAFWATTFSKDNANGNSKRTFTCGNVHLTPCFEN